MTAKMYQHPALANIVLSQSGEPPYDDGMEARVTRLETHMEYMRESLSEIKDGQKDSARTLMRLEHSLKSLPSKNDLWTWKVQWVGIMLVIFALIVGSIIGGLDWIKTH